MLDKKGESLMLRVEGGGGSVLMWQNVSGGYVLK